MQKLPNIVLIMSDQQRWDSIAMVIWHTPNLTQWLTMALRLSTPTPLIPSAHWRARHCGPASLPSTHGITYNRYGIDDVFNYEAK